jgi:probable F420-dependent oxidoreductase
VQFGIMFANTGHGASRDGAVAVIQAAEAGGFVTAWTVEHVVVPSGYESKYPYDESGKMAGGKDDISIPDPLIWLTWAAAHSTTIGLGTGILIATQRNPLITAKEVATLDLLSGGRVQLGVGVGWLKEEFDALGVPFGGRGRRLDEYIDVMRALWEHDKASHHGELLQFEHCISNPKPVSGTVPIIVGGHTEAAARRAGLRGDAFYPGNAKPDEIRHLVTIMRDAATTAGRDGDAIPIYAMAAGKPGDAMYARIDELASVGVTQTIVPTYRPDSLADIGHDLAARFAS